MTSPDGRRRPGAVSLPLAIAKRARPAVPLVARDRGKIAATRLDAAAVFADFARTLERLVAAPKRVSRRRVAR